MAIVGSMRDTFVMIIIFIQRRFLPDHALTGNPLWGHISHQQLGFTAHDLQAQLVNLYIDRQICEMDRLESEGSPVRRTDGNWVYPSEEELMTLARGYPQRH